MSVKKIEIRGQKCELIKDEETGRYACAIGAEHTPTFFLTEEEAIAKADKVIADSQENARQWHMALQYKRA